MLVKGTLMPVDNPFSPKASSIAKSNCLVLHVDKLKSVSVALSEGIGHITHFSAIWSPKKQAKQKY